jgi:hypothetical protein
MLLPPISVPVSLIQASVLHHSRYGVFSWDYGINSDRREIALSVKIKTLIRKQVSVFLHLVISDFGMSELNKHQMTNSKS